MIIDFHTHVMPPQMAADPVWRGKCPMTIENVLEAAKAGGVDRTVISNPAHELRHDGCGTAARDGAHEQNDISPR